MRIFVIVALVALIAATSAAQEPVTPSFAGDTIYDRLWNLGIMLLGGMITAAAGLLVGLVLFNRQRRETARSAATVLVAEVIGIRSILDQSLRAGVSDAAIGNLKLLSNRTAVYDALLPQIGILGRKNVGDAVQLHFGLELLVKDVSDMPDGITMASLHARFSGTGGITEHTSELLTLADQLISSLCRDFRIGDPFRHS